MVVNNRSEEFWQSYGKNMIRELQEINHFVIDEKKLEIKMKKKIHEFFTKSE